MKKQFKMIVAASEGPGFGAYLEGSAKDGEAHIVLNVLLNLAVDKNPKGALAESLAHEVLHACQDVLGEALTETDIEAAMAKINGIKLDETNEGDEHYEQIIQDNLNIIQQQLEYINEIENKFDIADVLRWRNQTKGG